MKKLVESPSCCAKDSILQFDLVCSNDFLITISQSVTMLGLLFGVVISGIVSDK